MRYIVKSDFILGTTLLLWGEKLFAKPTQDGTRHEFWSFHTRSFIGQLADSEMDNYVIKDDRPPKNPPKSSVQPFIKRAR